ncbi:MAG: nucleotidyl transferase AbiEii/AbiGii toxin family protein [bacterium]|nr:nucleotidyl transferase AbiEii/AbiGii toxin family protein [bacterium]MDY4979467.1 nucleotidyl transferase AbiEii/AbiGii toxin family protein [Candidatus Onthovivens sp.]
MKQVLNQMLAKYQINNIEDKKNAIKEIVQEIVLCGLSRGGFFKEAAFYGGTALRIFYGLDRFSEDLDFSLITQNQNFDLTKYFPYIENETKSQGLNFSVIEKNKSIDSNIKSAFLKGNIKEHILSFYEDSEDSKIINKEETIRIKFEVDINPATGATYETKFGLLPSPYQVRLYDLQSLFAGKIHACLCRNWKTRVKGRDFYDYIFFLSLGAKVNLDNLKAKLVQSKFISEDYALTIENLKLLLNERFENLDIDQAKQDVLPFIKDKSKLDLWSKEFFIEITKQLQAV